MSKKIDPHEPPLAGLNRLVNAQLDEMRAAAASQDDNRAHRIHLACKRIRTYLRLMRDVLGDERYRYENTLFRNLGRPFGTFRDTEVASKTIGSLIAGQSERISDLSVEALHGVARRLPMPDNDDLSEARIVAAVNAAHKRVSEPMQGDLNLEKAARRFYRRHRRDYGIARKSHDTAALHEWRKQAKYLRYALEATGVLWSGADPVRRTIKKVGDILGDDHDLAALHDGLARTDEADSDAGKAIARQREALQKKALKRGKALTRARPRAFVAKLKAA